MRKSKEGFDTRRYPEPTNKHSLQWFLMDTFPLVMGPLRENRKQEKEDEEDRADQWTLRARDPQAGYVPHDRDTSRAKSSTKRHAMDSTRQAQHSPPCQKCPQNKARCNARFSSIRHNKSKLSLWNVIALFQPTQWYLPGAIVFTTIYMSLLQYKHALRQKRFMQPIGTTSV